MNRLFSVRRRRPHIVDVLAPFIPGVDEYRLKAAVNFDDTFNTILTSSRYGYLDPNLHPAVVEPQPISGGVRIVFDPSSFSLTDDKMFWLQLYPVTGGVEGTPGAPTLVLPDKNHWGVNIVVISGAAPNSELQLDLPKLMEDIRFVNQEAPGGSNLLVGTEEAGPKLTIFPSGEQSLGYDGSTGSLYVMGEGGTVDFSASFSLAFPR